MEIFFADVFYTVFYTLVAEIIMFIIFKIWNSLLNKFKLKKLEYNLNGIWINEHKNYEGENIIEVAKIKQSNSEINIIIHQYKEKSYKKFKGKGIISGNNVMTYYIDTNPLSQQTGMIILNIKSDGKGNASLVGEYREPYDIENKRRRNDYILKRAKVNLGEKIRLFMLKEEKYKLAKSIKDKY